MKKLIIFSILAACVMSGAQTQNLNQLTAVELAKRTIVVFPDSQAQKKIWILDSKTPNVNQAVQKELENYRKQTGKQINLQETLIGGWQPELSEVGKHLNEIAHVFGNECSQARVGSWLQTVTLDADEAIEINSLSAQAQDCLRR